MTVALDQHLQMVLAELERDLTADERDLLRQLVQHATSPTELLSMLEDLAGWKWKWRPVDTETFILTPDFLGLDGTRGRIFPKLLDDLVELFEDPLGYEQAVLDGGIGFGKSTLAWVAMARMLYEVSCLKNPQRTYGLMDGTTIALLNASVSKEQATKVVFGDLKQALTASPYFKDAFAFDAALKKEFRFPHNILVMPVAGSEQGTVGYTVFGAVLDEVNFWQQTEKSVLNRGQRYDAARHIYDLLVRRIQSRFNKAGKLPGVILQVSSSKYPDDFTEERRQEVKQALADHAAHPDEPAKYPHPKTLVRRYSTWSTKPRASFLPEDFWLYVGTSADQPAIALDREEFADKNPELVVPVPMDFYESFKRDLTGSLRDLAGYPTLAIRPYLTNKDKVLAAFERGRQLGRAHPYTVEVTTLQDGAALIVERLKPRADRRYFAHIDLALKKDAAGVAIGHIEAWKTVTRALPTGGQVSDVMPVIVIDLMLKVVAPEGEEIGVDDVRALLLQCRQHGMHYKKITYDQYQSASSIQYFNSIGIESEKLSVDVTMEPYDSMKEAMYEDRLVLYPYPPLLEELVRLEVKPVAKGKVKVDHPPKGSKDVADAVAGVVYHCTLAKKTAQVDPSFGDLYSVPDGAIPSTWVHPAAGLMPTTVRDKDGNDVLLPGRKKRTIDDILFRGAPGWEDPADEVDGFIGFA